ncbi:hypothetical protein [Myxosarcina sp. GI1]|uniref:hypothetical protein n=1 Tax=Myxosarcina sp. GI1 TaxID=1541065 RepID=UPI00155A7A8B|nr:hypothetical protein [Myxosarcina sp. GI1]
MAEILNKLSISAMNNCIQAVLNVEVAIACNKKSMKPSPKPRSPHRESRTRITQLKER